MKAFNLAGLHYRQEMVKCGKKTCRRCPHGPYWYAYHYLMIFMKKTYVGHYLPPGIELALKDGHAIPCDLDYIDRRQAFRRRKNRSI